MPERRITLKSARELTIMREANRIVADTLVLLADQAHPGVTTRELDDLATEHVLSRGAKPSFPLVNFDGTTCISINNETVHGMPGKRVLRPGIVLAVERVVSRGRAQTVALDDGWTAVRQDPSVSAYFERGVARTAQRYAILW